MKITQILNLLIFLICFSCDRAANLDSYETANRKKEEVLRIQHQAHKDSILSMYDSIKISHFWEEVEIVNRKTKILKRKDTLYPRQEISIDIITVPEVHLIWSVDEEKTKSFQITGISNRIDSLIFYTTQYMTNETRIWVFKYINKEKTLGSWSIYNPETKSFIITGKYIDVKEKYE